MWRHHIPVLERIGEHGRVQIDMSRREAEWAYFAVGCLPHDAETQPLYDTLREAVGPDRAREITLRGIWALR
jgi:hypothetical protein